MQTKLIKIDEGVGLIIEFLELNNLLSRFHFDHVPPNTNFKFCLEFRL